MLPQILALFSLVSIFAVLFSQWFLLGLVFLVFLLPLPAVFRRELELRGYTMSLAINYWRHGSIQDSSIDWVVKAFTGWGYYRMCPDEKYIRTRLSDIVQRIHKMDHIGSSVYDLIFLDSPVYEEVYSLMTGADR